MPNLCLRLHGIPSLANILSRELSRIRAKTLKSSFLRPRVIFCANFSSITLYNSSLWRIKKDKNDFKIVNRAIYSLNRYCQCEIESCWRQKQHLNVLTTAKIQQANNCICGKRVGRQECRKQKSTAPDKRGNQSENIFTVPNVLSLFRISLAPVIGYFILNLDYTTALAFLGLAGVTDLLDGFIARNFKNQSTVFGSMLDPVADKVLMSIMTVSLTYVSLLPVQLCALIIGRDIGLILAVAYLRYKTLPSPLTLSRYFDFNLPTVQMKPTQISKYNTGLQLGLVGLCLAAPVFGFVDSYMLHAYWYLVGSTTILAGLSYVANKDTFKIIKQKR